MGCRPVGGRGPGEAGPHYTTLLKNTLRPSKAQIRSILCTMQGKKMVGITRGKVKYMGLIITRGVLFFCFLFLFLFFLSDPTLSDYAQEHIY